MSALFYTYIYVYSGKNNQYFEPINILDDAHVYQKIAEKQESTSHKFASETLSEPHLNKQTQPETSSEPEPEPERQ